MRENPPVVRLTILAGMMGALACSQAGATQSDSLATDEQRQAYSLGAVVAMQARDGIGEIDSAAFIAGMSDAMTGAEMALSPEQIQTSLASFEQSRKQEAEEALDAQAEENRAQGEAYRERFAAEEGVVTLESGLAYKVLQAGEGRLPAGDASVKVHYRASFVDGREFDSSYASDEPAVLPVQGLMEGFSEALTRMPEGSKWKIVIPPALAYGSQGAGPIGPDTTLVFEMELVSAG